MSSLTTVFVVALIIHASPHSCLSTFRTSPQVFLDSYYNQELNLTTTEVEPMNNVSLWEEVTAVGAEGATGGEDVPKFWPFDQGTRNGSLSMSGCFQEVGLAGCLKIVVEHLFGTTGQVLDETGAEVTLQHINGSSSEGVTPRKRRKDASVSPVIWLLLLSKMSTLPLALLVLKAVLMSCVSLAVALVQSAALAGKQYQPSAGREDNHEHQLGMLNQQMAQLAQ